MLLVKVAAVLAMVPRLRGGERLSVELGRAERATFHLPRLPAPDGSALLERAGRRMHRLRSYRVDEVLSSGLATVRATYVFVVPDRARISIRGGPTRVLVGGTQYLGQHPGGRWQVREGPPLEVPSFTWDAFLPAVAPRVVGREVVAGVPIRVVSFVGSGPVPVWFRLWIDDRGLVRRAEMRAQGHFMDHRYSRLDAPLSVEPPRPSG